MDTYKPYSFNLLRPVPIIINYITCAIEDGELKKYADPYNLDKALLNRLFHKVNFSPITEMTEN
jgi:murein L,D-transpeptidase YcbB/YkuD